MNPETAVAAPEAAPQLHHGVVESPLGMAVTDPAGRYLEVNRAFCSILGRPRDELVGHHYGEFTPDFEMPYADDTLRRINAGEISVFQADKRYVHPTRGIVYALVSTTAVRDDDGHLLHCVHQLQDITDSRRMENALRDSLERLRQGDIERQRLLGHLVKAQEEERARIAADVHDDSLQALAAVKMRLEMLTATLSDEQRALVGPLEADLDAASMRLRRLLFELRPTALDEESLGSAVEQLLAETFAGRDLATRVLDSLRCRPAADTKVVVYRILQEAVTNVLKHAHASNLEVHLADHDAGILVSVRDDGTGFDQQGRRRANAPGHLGLWIMRDRAEIAGGWLRVEAAPGAGTAVTFWIPSRG